MTVNLLPPKAHHMTQSEPRDTREYSGSRDDAEEVPQTARKGARLELGGKKPPPKRRGPDEPGQKAEVCGDVLDRVAAKLVELGKNRVLPGR